MFTTWIFTAVIIILFRLLIWKGAKLVPSCGQQIIESIIDGLRGIFEPLMGEKAFKGAFPLLLGFFSYILIMNWSGLLPGVGSIGLEQQADGTTKFVPFLRPANTDLNTTLALAIISFVAWIYFVGKYVGLKGFLKDTFGNKADKKEIALPIYFSLFFVFFAVGCIDIVSILMRLLSLSFRLFGNNFGGEVLLENMHHLAIDLPRWASWIIPIPFYLLEMLIGLIQAFLFSLLTAVYIGLLTGHEEHE
ncbi:MAG: F0F1 ATP synthase subunit A [Opitutales bacterium]|nr:F0F1 ATP synthase subunit A [Opitutales bacterium]